MATRVLLLALLALTACGDAPSGDNDAVVEDEAPAPEVYNSSLDEGDDTLVSGEYIETYDAVAREGQWIRVQLVSGDFDPYLLILSPTDEQTDVDDSSLGNTSMTKAIVEATEGGRWQIVVTTYEVGESGDYELTIEVLDERPDDADEGVQVAPEEADEAASDTLSV